MKIVEKIVDLTTGEEQLIEREETSEEKKFREKRLSEIKAAEKDAAEKASARQAILDRLGLTEDEAKLLLG